jgi:hypothetical protein
MQEVRIGNVLTPIEQRCTREKLELEKVFGKEVHSFLNEMETCFEGHWKALQNYL